MPYALIDDQMYDHPKMVGLPDAAGWLWARGLSWCTRHLTDGFIPTGAVRTLAGSTRKANQLSKLLVSSGLWEEHEGGYQYHDFHHHNPSGKAVRARRAEVSEAKARAGRKGAEARWGNGKPDGTDHGTSDGTPMAPAMANGWHRDGPVPVPVPPLVTPTDSSSSRGGHLPSPIGVVEACPTCDCPTDRPGTHQINGIDVICDHTPPPEEDYLA